MAVGSMTGFARAAGSGGAWRWTFELKTVNAKGLDIRLRMPAPFDRAEGEARTRLAKALARGTCFANLSAQREGATTIARIDLAALESIALAARAAAVKAGLAPPTMDGLLTLRGVLETADIEDDEAAVNAAINTPWSNGPVEGHVNRLKTIKRQMYGRAGMPLLRARVLHAA